MERRRSKRKKARLVRRLPEFFTRCCEELEKPGGLSRAIRYVKSADAQKIAEANEVGIGPVVRAILVCGSTNSITGCDSTHVKKLLDFIAICKNRGVDIGLGCHCTGIKWQVPIVAASFYGIYQVVDQLLDFGTPPGYANEEGMTALHTALIDPTGSSARCKTLRGCDVLTIRTLHVRGLLTSKISSVRHSNPGALIYINSEKMSPLYYSILNKNHAAVLFLYSAGAQLSDRDYLHLCRDRKARKHIHRLLPAIVYVVNSCGLLRHGTNERFDKTNVRIYDSHLNWSYPNSWHQAFVLTNHLNLPREVFLHVASYCNRGWFFKTDEPDMEKDYPPEYLAPHQKAISFYSFRTSF
eukprot:g5556.t1